MDGMCHTLTSFLCSTSLKQVCYLKVVTTNYLAGMLLTFPCLLLSFGMDLLTIGTLSSRMCLEPRDV